MFSPNFHNKQTARSTQLHPLSNCEITETHVVTVSTIRISDIVLHQQVIEHSPPHLKLQSCLPNWFSINRLRGLVISQLRTTTAQIQHIETIPLQLVLFCDKRRFVVYFFLLFYYCYLLHNHFHKLWFTSVLQQLLLFS